MDVASERHGDEDKDLEIKHGRIPDYISRKVVGGLKDYEAELAAYQPAATENRMRARLMDQIGRGGGQGGQDPLNSMLAYSLLRPGAGIMVRVSGLAQQYRRVHC